MEEFVDPSGEWYGAIPKQATIIARLYERCVSSRAKPTMRESASAMVRRSMDLVVKNQGWGRRWLIDIVLTMIQTEPKRGPLFGPFLGTLAGIAAKHAPSRETFQSLMPEILGFYKLFFLESKQLIQHRHVVGLKDLFMQFLTQEELTRELVPALEKALLRSPEVVLRGVLSGLAQSLNPTIDLTEVLSQKLIQPLLNAMKSSDENLRNGAQASLKSILLRCHEIQGLTKVAEDLLGALKTAKGTNTEFRILVARLLTKFGDETEQPAVTIVRGLLPIVTKETNEQVFRAEVIALSSNFRKALKQGSALGQSELDQILKAAQDKRPFMRKWWLFTIGTCLSELDSVPSAPASQEFVKSALDLLTVAYAEVVGNPTTSTQGGLASAAFVFLSLFQGNTVVGHTSLVANKNKYVSVALSLHPKPSFLLNPRVYTKFAGRKETMWAVTALLSLAPELRTCSDDVRGAWAQELIYFMTSPDVPSASRQDAVLHLSQQYLKNPEIIGSSIVRGLWSWLQALQDEDKNSVALMAKADLSGLRTCVACINPPHRVWAPSEITVPEDILEQQASTTPVMFRSELIPSVDWIEMCLRVGVDPGTVALKHQSSMITDILSKFHTDTQSRWITLETAAKGAAGTLAFVAPQTMIPALLQAVETDLDGAQLDGIGPTEMAMASMPDGEAFVDILNEKGSNVTENKNIKDYDVLKWEEELRQQLAKKTASSKKLTTEQQAKVSAQLRHEASVRQNVLEVSRNVRRGATLVRGLAEGPPTDARMWMNSAVSALLDAIKAGAALLEANGLFDAYVACSRLVNERLGSLRESIGIATLRAYGNIQLPIDFTAEDLGELITRVLYRLRFAGEQRPFDAASLAYMLPLILEVLSRGGVATTKTEDADAQVLLALEFLGFHTDVCADLYLPRFAILSQIIASFRQYPQHYRIIKDMLLEFCRSISSNLTARERNLLLSSLTSSESSTRSAILQAIDSELDLSDLETSSHIWLIRQDEEEDNAVTAMAIWEESEMRITQTTVDELLPFATLTSRGLRVSFGKALAAALVEMPSIFQSTVEILETTYVNAAQPPVPKRDKFGIVQKQDLADHWETRSGLAIAFKCLVSNFPTEAIVPFVEYLIKAGPLMDRNSTVREEMINAGTHLVSNRGGECLEPLMKMVGTTLDAPSQDTQESDWLREAVIVLYGSLAQHLPANDERSGVVIQRLIEALSTPSEQVQFAVANCLSPLARNDDTDIGTYVSQLVEQLFGAKQFATRRGAAYGLAGVVQGRGLSALRQFRLMSTLASATENKKSVEHRQGAMFAYEILSTMLGRTFEPYVVEILPQLLVSFGDVSPLVRNACLDAAKTCFSSLSSFGVHRVLPRLLEGLSESQWRSKKGACELLGAMAYLDSEQLANSLPDIIPPLTAVLTDSHKEVRAAANSSLQRFGEVITNPEIKSLVNILLKALSDPTKYTEEALDGLIKVSFVHYLDAPSLALVVRILERGLGDRSSTKRKSAQIIGSLAHLTERRDLATHLPILESGLRSASIDAVPSTRATASKALGSLVEKLGEDSFPELIPSLMVSLRTDTGASDRLGAAQALSEVLAGLGTSRLEDTLPTILQNASSHRPAVREGFMTLFIYLPACFGNSFANYLSQIIPAILGGLADEVEAIREIALRAGRLLVKNYATKAIDLLLPELQRGLADYNHRIRLSSVELVGDLLFSLTGISQDTEAGEEEVETAAQAGQSLLEVLGQEKRDRVLSSLYICRCDTSGTVRAAAIAVWKSLVSTPRTLREIVPTLIDMIINRLASPNSEQKAIAGNALGEVIRKSGEGVFTSLLPTLEQGLSASHDSDYRQGICMALHEIISAAPRETIDDHSKTLVSILSLALADTDLEVREAAAESFDALQKLLGKQVVDQVLPPLLSALRNEDEAEQALSALLTLLTDNTRANVILPNLLPTLLTSPMSTFNAKALASLAEVAGDSINRRLPRILETLADNIERCGKTNAEDRAEFENAFDAVLASVDEYDGLNTAMSVMLQVTMIKSDSHSRRTIAISRLASFFKNASVDFSRYNQDLIRVLLLSFDDRDMNVVINAHQALADLQSRLRKEEMETLVPSTRQIVSQIGVAGADLPGFSIPKGIQTVLAIFVQGLLNGTSEQRLQAAYGMADMISKTSGDSLKLFMTQLAGPLIRVAGERSSELKIAVMGGLKDLITKMPAALRPFYPQLQRTFTKAIGDNASEVLRNRAIEALVTLIPLIQRIDPLITELVTGARISLDSGVQNANLKALQEALSLAASNMSDASRDSVLRLIDRQQDEQDTKTLVTNARLLGAMIKVLPTESAAPLIKARMLIQPITNSSILTLNAILLETAVSLKGYQSEVESVITNGIAGKNTFIQHNAILAAGKLLLTSETDMAGRHPDTVSELIAAITDVILPGNDIDTRRLGLVVIRTVTRHHPDAIRTHNFKNVHKLAPAVFSGVRDPVIPVKLAAEAAWLELFDVVDRESQFFDKYLADPDTGASLPKPNGRQMSEYFKRISLKLASQARERIEAGGGAIGLSSDEEEDEREVWSVGSVQVLNVRVDMFDGAG